MALGFFLNIQNLWPFSLLKYDDLRLSDELVRKLSVPEHTKRFIFAVREPETQSVIYILAAQNLSERSAIDAECLIREVRPDAVVAQVSNSSLTEIQSEESELRDGAVPTSSFGVLKRCFVDKINKERYEYVAGNSVLREIFGTSFHGHFFAAKGAAEEVGSSFLVLESPSVKSSVGDNPPEEIDTGYKFQGLVSSLVPQKAGSVVFLSSKRFFLTNDFQKQMVKLLSPYLDLSIPRLSHSTSASEVGSKEIQPIRSYEAPPFAQSIYPLLADLHNIFSDLPSIGNALAHAQKMLLDVNRGEIVDISILSEVYTFRIAVEGLRVALNNAGRLPINKIRNSMPAKIDFSELPFEDKSHALFAQALRSQTKKFQTIVAVVDAGGLANLRKHWNTPVPLEVKDLVEQLVTNCEGAGELSNHNEGKRLLTGKPVVAVGAGATAVLGASYVSKVVPASTVMKVLTFKVPASLKILLSQTQKATSLALGKTLGTSKVVAPSIASYGAKTTSIFKATASAEKIRLVTHSVIASAEKTSFSAMRTAFYEIMRKRQVRPIGLLPWATFACSIATCSSLLVYGDGIECAAESLPSAPSIASLGRGIQSLHQAPTSLKAIYLRNCSLHGEFPTGIFQLPNLKSLSVHLNSNLTGRVPEFNRSIPLEDLRLSGTGFSGMLPDSIGNLKSLHFFDVGGCNFSGPLPFSFGNLTELTFLDLSDNNFNRGTLSWVGKQTKLTFLNLYETNLYGDIPYSLGNLTHLETLSLSSNELTGPIPSWLANLTQLTQLWLQRNKLHGPIPTSVYKLRNLQILDLCLNRLSGTVELGLFRELSSLFYLQLSDNNLSLLIDPSTNISTLQKFKVLGLASCHLSEFPEILRNQDQLQVLLLSRNKIHGQIPKWISNLSKDTLVSLDMSENFLTGFEEAPNSLPWTSLLVLYLSNNKLQGPLPIPPPSTVYYKVHSNMLSGEITQMICNLSFLSYLDLSYNNLSGYLPQCLGNLSNLSILNLQHNNFRGHIPQMFIEGCQLSMINLNQNHFQGALPRSLANCTMLEILDIGNNHISDIFPSWLGTLPELGVLILRSNGFHGAIGKPETNSTFPKLHVIDLSNNYITGKLPYEYFQIWKGMQSYDAGGLTYMQARVKIHIPSCGWLYTYTYQMTLTNKGIKTEYWKIQDYFVVIDLSGNRFEGEIPKIVGNLKAVCTLNLSNNFLNGSIPSSLANLKNLESLDISQNMLVGEIPPQLVELTFLAFLNLSHNHLSGTIPQGKQFFTFENNSFNGNVELCGSPLSKRCANLKDPPPPPSIFVENEEAVSLFEFDWKVVVMGYGCGFIFGVFGGKIIIKKKNDWFMKTFAIGHPPRRRVN